MGPGCTTPHAPRGMGSPKTGWLSEFTTHDYLPPFFSLSDERMPGLSNII